MGNSSRSPELDRIIGVVVLLSMIPQFALLFALLPPEAPVPEVMNNTEGASVFVLQTASQAWLPPATMLLFITNVLMGSFFIARSRMGSLDSYDGTAARPLVVLGGIVVLPLLFLACLAVCCGIGEPFFKFRSVTVTEKTVELRSLAGEWSIDRTDVAGVEIVREDRTSYSNKDFWRYHLVVHTKSGKLYRSADIGAFKGNDPDAARWWQFLQEVKSLIGV